MSEIDTNLATRNLDKRTCGMQVIPCCLNSVAGLIEKWHYSHSTNGLKVSYCFKLTQGHDLLGGSIFGKLAMGGVWQQYVEQEEDILELRRLVCVDNTPRNTESYFISRCLDWLRRNTLIQRVVSYADPEFGHDGTIYKASNFKLVGRTSPGRVIVWNGKRYHDKAIRTTYGGAPKPFAAHLKQALLSGEAYYIVTEPKYVYIFDIVRRRSMLVMQQTRYEIPLTMQQDTERRGKA